MKNIIEVKGLNKLFKMSKDHENHVIKDVDLVIEEGEFVSIMGPSGSGKSTLLYNISGMDVPTSGSIKFNDTLLESASEEELAAIRLNKMGFVFQQSHLLKDLNIKDNILLPGFTSKKKSQESVVNRCHELIKELGLSELESHKITEVSGGQLQRVSIARALINDPMILFGDEPTGALNTTVSEDVMDIFQKINKKGTTVLIVTHDPKVALKSDRVLIMKDGRIESDVKLESFNVFKERESVLNQHLKRYDI